MAVTSTTLSYPGDDGTVLFTAPAVDLDVSVLLVYLDGVLQTVTTHYTYDNGAAQVTMVTPPATGETLALVRSTDVAARIVDFANVAILNEDSLDKDSKQALNKLQELEFASSGAELITKDLTLGGNWNAQTLQIKNVVDGTLAQDAATKNQLDTQTHVAADVTDFDTQVRTNRLDQMATPTSGVDVGNVQITSLGTPSLTTDAATKGYCDGLKVHDLTLATAALNMNTQKISGVVDGTLAQDAATKNMLDTQTHVAADVTDFDTQVRTSTLNQMATPTADLSMGTNKITAVVAPTASTDAANKAYVDGLIGASLPAHQEKAAGTYTVVMPTDNDVMFTMQTAAGDVLMELPTTAAGSLDKGCTFVNDNENGYFMKIRTGSGSNLVFNGNQTGNNGTVTMLDRGSVLTVRDMEGVTNGTWVVTHFSGGRLSLSDDNKTRLEDVACRYTVATNGGGVGTIDIGWLPYNAQIYKGFVICDQNFGSATSAASISLGVETDDIAGIIADTIVTDPQWDQGRRAIIPAETYGTETSKATGVRAVRLTITNEDLTAGAMTVYLKYRFL